MPHLDNIGKVVVQTKVGWDGIEPCLVYYFSKIKRIPKIIHFHLPP